MPRDLITHAVVHGRTALTLALIVSVSALGAPLPAIAQCQKWVTGPLVTSYPGVTGVVYASTTWDPDGSGPRPEFLVIGGSFTHVNGVAAENIATWDGVVWRQLAMGVNGTVRALTVFNGTIVVAGSFTAASGLGTTYVARWNDSYWTAMGTGMFGGTGIHALAVHNGQLYAGGDFEKYLRRWDSPGSTWVSLGQSPNSVVYALASMDGYLYAGGSFTSGGFTNLPKFGRWNGSAWWGPSFGPNGTVFSLTVINSELFVGGQFNDIDGQTFLNHLVKWDGSDWLGLDCGAACGLKAAVRCVTYYNSQVHAGGDFHQGAINGSARRVARLFDGYWYSVGNGIGPGAPSSDVVHTLTVYRGELFAGGSFTSPTSNLARWNGTSWVNASTPATIRAFAAYGSRMAIGGAFQQYTSGGDAFNLLSWNGTDISRLGSGTDAPIHAMTGYTESTNPVKYRLVVGGEFTNAGGLSASRVALWTESDNVFQTGWSTLGAGFNGPVMALARHAGRTVAGGIFTQSGASAPNYISRWDGTAWQPMGTGMNNSVFALKSYKTSALTTVLIAGGGFTAAGGVPANFIASWVTTENVIELGWNPMGSGFNNTVYAVERFSGSTYAAGAFTASGATPLNRVARYAGSASGWVAVGAGFDGIVRSLWTDGVYLYAAGDFTGRVSRWNGTSWAIVDGGTNGSTVALTSYHGEVLAGGSFTTARTAPVPTVGMARFLATGTPWLTGLSWSQTVNEGGLAVFRADPADGYAPLTYTWRRNGTPLTGGATGNGSTIYFNDPTMAIDHAAIADTGYYDCVVSNGCGDVTGGGGQLIVTTVAGVGDGDRGGALAMAAGPNPFARETNITFRLAEPADVRVRIHDARGRLVRRLESAGAAAGPWSLIWDGRDDEGHEAPTGMYFVQLTAGPLTAGKRLVRLR